ncbi:hypothetical protein EZS27_036475, partial [termite gut metagenome]
VMEATDTVSNCFYSGYDNAGYLGESNTAQAFSSSAWPASDSGKNWGVGTSGTDGVYWKSIGSWNGGTPTYPTLYWE